MNSFYDQVAELTVTRATYTQLYYVLKDLRWTTLGSRPFFCEAICFFFEEVTDKLVSRYFETESRATLVLSLELKLTPNIERPLCKGKLNEFWCCFILLKKRSNRIISNHLLLQWLFWSSFQLVLLLSFAFWSISILYPTAPIIR